MRRRRIRQRQYRRDDRTEIMSNPKVRETDIPLHVSFIILFKDFMSKFMTPFHIPVFRGRILVIAYSALHGTVQTLPYPRTKPPSRQ